MSWFPAGVYSVRLPPSPVVAVSRVAAILVGIDANELNNVFACRHFIMPKIGKIGGFLGCSEHAFEHTVVTPMTLGQPNSVDAAAR